MTFQARAWLGLAGLATLTLAGCVEGARDAQPGGAPAIGAAASPVSVTRDVESPEVFNLKGPALWDGRPSLGGVWVAHSSVKDPERVIIRNAKNGKSAVGALFRRERDLPGPGIQVSSDAAEVLGLLAGQPAELTIVALRREEKPVPADAEIGATDEPAPAVETAVEPAVETAADPATAGTAAPGTTGADKADGAAATAATNAPEAQSPAPAAAAAVAPDAAGDEAADAAAGAEPQPKKSGGLFGFLKKKPKPAASEGAAVATGAGAGAIEQSTLDPVAASAAAAIDRAEAAAPKLPAAGSTGVQPAAAPATLKRGYIQIGIFSTEANANRASAQMKAAGMAATVKPETSGDKTYWRVFVGPAASVAERDALVARVKGIGYPDAYPVSN